MFRRIGAGDDGGHGVSPGSSIAMSRLIRIEFANDLYHVNARGERRKDIFEDDADRHAFQDILARSSSSSVGSVRSGA